MNYLFAFDLDGTLTTKEILPVIAQELGIEKKMAMLTKRTMDGEIPFDQSFTMRVDMLKKIPISRVQKIVNSVPLSSSILKFIQKNKSKCCIVTGNLDVWIKPLVEKVGIPYYCSTANYRGDTLFGIKNIFRKKNIRSILKKPFVAIGEGHNDVEMLMEANISIAYGGIHHPSPSILEITNYAIYDEKELCKILKRLL